MQLLNYLSAAVVSLVDMTNEVQIDWLGEIIKNLIEGCGSYGLGIIVFSLILRLITLPFDIFSRISTKKNSIIMEKMKPQLERLQRQYANNKELYNKKMMALYKENGYSQFSACLPTLLTLVIFVVVIGQFSTYSNYANLSVFCDMSESYNNAVETFNDNTQTDTLITVDGKYYLNVLTAYNDANASAFTKHGDVSYPFTIVAETENGNDTVFNLPGYDNPTGEQYQNNVKAFLEYALSVNYYSSDNNYMTVDFDGTDTECDVYFDVDTNCFKFKNGKDEKTGTGELITAYVGDVVSNDYLDETVRFAARTAAAETYREKDLGFLWINNIWISDSPLEHPIKSKFADYNFTKSSGCFSTCSCNGTDNKITAYNDEFNEITSFLTNEKTEPNGYFILIALSIGIMFVSQIVMQKMQKTQMELSTVDGANGTTAQTQKMMTWMMPIMFGVFSFFYSASFSLYIIVSTTVSTTSTLLINYLVGKHYEKKAKTDVEEYEKKRFGKVIPTEDKSVNKDNSQNADSNKKTDKKEDKNNGADKK